MVDQTPLPTELVISGISTKVPESGNISEFADNLIHGKDMVTTSRWTPGIYGLPARNGILKDLDKFDAPFFGMSSKAAHEMDPMLRLLLELTFEAIFDAGINPESLRGSKTGVFVGACKSESAEIAMNDPDRISEHTAPGFSRFMFANGLSQFFNLTGPSLTVETACSASLLALERAVASIRSGQCEAAIVGGANLLLKPQASLEFHRLNMLAMDGKCKAFDASGNGYVRSEAVVVILIQKKQVALRLYATIIHARTNSDGYKEQGITYPSGAVQKELLEDVYSEAGVNPASVAYVEAHGTGTKVGDPQELNAISEFFCKERDASSPLLIGSVKSNMGHAERASGLCSLAKVVIAFKYGVIPGNLHFKDPNTEIPALLDGRLKVVDQNLAWNGGLVGINSFGFGGANVHVILKSGHILEKLCEESKFLPMLLPISGRTELGVQAALDSIAYGQSNFRNASPLLHNVAKLPIAGHPYRGFALMKSDGITETSVFKSPDSLPPVWYIISGMGSQWTGMGRDLLKFDIFKKSFDKSAEILKSHNFSLYDVILSDDVSLMESTMNSFVCIAAIQIGMVDLLAGIGINPDGLIGHSVGENVCGYADGSSTHEEAILLSYFVGSIFDKSELPAGAMAAVGLSWEETKRRCPEDVHPACNNAPDNVSIAGPVDSIRKFVAALNSEKIFAREIRTGQAFHSPLVEGNKDKFTQILTNNGIFKSRNRRSSKWISTSVPESQWSSHLAQSISPKYFSNNLVSPVRFLEALAHVPENALVIEIGPHALLQAVLKRSLPSTCNILGISARNAKDNAATFLSAIGKIYGSGHDPDISVLYPEVAFPVSSDGVFLSPLVSWDHSESFTVANFEQSSARAQAEIEISLNTHPYLEGHRIDGKVMFPATGYIFLVWSAFAKHNGTTFDQLPVSFEKIEFLEEPIILEPDDEPMKFSASFLRGSGAFELRHEKKVVASGKIKMLEGDNSTSEELDCDADYQYNFISSANIYEVLKIRGYDYGGIFQGILNANHTFDRGILTWNVNWTSFLDAMAQFQILGDHDQRMALRLPTRIDYLALNPIILMSHIQKIRESHSTLRNAVNIRHFHNQKILKCPGVEMKGLEMHGLSRENLENTDSNGLSDFKPLKGSNPLKNCIALKFDEALHLPINTQNLVPEYYPPAFQFSGITQSGKRLMGIGIEASTESSMAWEIPEDWCLEDTVTVSAAYATAYYALIVRGDMRPGESILIHCGTQDVSLAAIRIALGMKCHVFTTVESAKEKQILKSQFPELHDSCFASSNDARFEQHVLNMTEGQGVDLVLNSLSGDKFQASIRCLANEGRFLQIGKFDMANNSILGMAIFLKNVSFHGILLESLFQENCYDSNAVYRAMSSGVESGFVTPLLLNPSVTTDFISTN